MNGKEKKLHKTTPPAIFCPAYISTMDYKIQITVEWHGGYTSLVLKENLGDISYGERWNSTKHLLFLTICAARYYVYSCLLRILIAGTLPQEVSTQTPPGISLIQQEGKNASHTCKQRGRKFHAATYWWLLLMSPPQSIQTCISSVLEKVRGFNTLQNGFHFLDFTTVPGEVLLN